MLLKAIALALPTYTMACFMLPKTVCKQIVSIMADFWWRNNKDSRGMHWKSWEYLSKPKTEGRLGFKDLQSFNLALLGKQLWRLMTRGDTLLAKVFKSRYFRDTDALNAPLGSRPSYAWRNIHAAQRLIKQGARVVIGNDRNTNVWSEKWLGSKPAKMVQAVKRSCSPSQQGLLANMKVSELMLDNGREWNLRMI